jgi:hypothetical protein
MYLLLPVPGCVNKITNNNCDIVSSLLEIHKHSFKFISMKEKLYDPARQNEKAPEKRDGSCEYAQ